MNFFRRPDFLGANRSFTVFPLNSHFMRHERNLISQDVEDIGHGTQGKIPAAVEHLGDKPLGLPKRSASSFRETFSFSRSSQRVSVTSMIKSP